MSLNPFKDLKEAQQLNHRLTQQVAELNQKMQASEIAGQNRLRAVAAEHTAAVNELQQAKAKVDSALQKAVIDAASLSNALAQLRGESAFVEIGVTRFLISSIHTIEANDRGEIMSVNGVSFRLATVMPAQALEAIVSAYHNRNR